MSQLSQSLERRIKELTASIEAQRAELAAYEHVLRMELQGPHRSSSLALPPAPRSSGATETHRDGDGRRLGGVSYTGNKTALVVDIVGNSGNQGVTPKDIDAGFSEQNVARSKNLIYNTLSYLVSRKRLVRRSGKYFLPGQSRATGGGSVAPAKKTATKRRLTPEGLKRIKEALKRRWAAQKAAAAEGQPVSLKSRATKSAARPAKKKKA